MRKYFGKLKNRFRKLNLTWKYVLNLKPTIRYTVARSTLSSEQSKKVVRELNIKGISITSVEELLKDRKFFDDLDSEANSILDNRKIELQELKSKAAADDFVGQKTFNVQLLGEDVEFDSKSVFARFALQESFIEIAKAYFGMQVSLRYYDVWITFATTSEARESQLWHYDREDQLILKIFCYLDDVDEGAGPFTYAPETHQKGSLRNETPEYFYEQRVQRSTDKQMSDVIPSEKWIRALGKKGTLVFADTRGYHKGGEARSRDRLMFVAMFTSPASDSKRLIRYSEQTNLDGLSSTQRGALEFNNN